MNPSYKLTKKSAAAREEARKAFTRAEVDRIVEDAHRDREAPFLSFFNEDQKAAFTAFENSFAKSTRYSFAKVFVILTDFSDLYRTG